MQNSNPAQTPLVLNYSIQIPSPSSMHQLKNQIQQADKSTDDDFDYYDDDEEYDEDLDEDEPDEDDQYSNQANTFFPNPQNQPNSNKLSQAKRPKGELICVVCGASANGYNFDAITCESCKAFFRRNAFRPLNLFRCSNNNSCVITVQTRKKCKKCRIVKCFNLGMRRDWIMTENEREEKRRKIEENRRKKATGPSQFSSQQQLQDTTYHHQQDTDQSFILCPNSKPIRRRRRRRRHSLCEDLNQPNPSQTTTTTTTKCSTSIPKKQTKPCQQTNNHPTEYSNLQGSSLSLNCLTARYQHQQFYPVQYEVNYTDMASSSSRRKPITITNEEDEFLEQQTCRQMSTTPPSDDNNNLPSLLNQSLNQEKFNQKYSHKLTGSEMNQIEAIRLAYKQAIQLVKAQGTPRNSEDINTTINLTELGVRRIIFFFKLISDFRSLEHDLMVKLLKQSMMSILQIHGVNSYNKLDDTFKEPDTDDSPFAAQSLEAVYGTEVYKITIGITQNLYELCSADMTYIKMLMLITVFDPINPNLTEEEKNYITKIQNKFVSLFYAYMCENYGVEKAGLVFKGIMFEVGKIGDLAKFFEKAVVEKANYEYVRPLMKEVFSFPNDNTPPSSNNSSANSCERPESVSVCEARAVSNESDFKLESIKLESSPDVNRKDF